MSANAAEMPAAAAASTAAAAAPTGAKTSSLQEWLRHLHFGAPAISLDMSSPARDGELAFEGGNCTALNVGSVRTEDLSVGPALLWTFNISGVGIKCTLQSPTTGLSADVALRDSWVAASLAVQPFDFSGKPLPVAAMMSDCSSGLQVSDMHFGGSSEMAAELNANKSAAVRQLKAALHEELCVRIPGVVTSAGSNMLENVAMIVAELMQPPPIPQPPRAVAPLVDWGAYPPILLGEAMLADRFARWQSSRTSGKDVVKLGVDMNFQAPGDFDLGLGLGALELSGIDTLRAPGLALSGDGNGTIELETAARQLSLTVMGKIGVVSQHQQMPGLVEGWNLTVGLSNLSLAVQALAMLSAPMFDALKVQQLQSIGCIIDCARGAADPAEGSIGLRTLAVNASSLKLLVGASGALEQEVAGLADSIVGSLLTGYWQSIVSILNGLGTYWFSSLTDKLWTHLDEQAYTCDGPAGVEGVIGDSALTGLWGMSVALAFAGVGAGILACALPCCRKDESEESAAAQGSERFHDDPEAGSTSTVPSAEEASGINACLASSVPRPLAVFFPFAVFSVMFLFFFADLDLGTSVDVRITAGGESTTFGSLFSFSLIGTIRSTWEAEAYAISVLTLLFSGLWPLVKLVLLLVAWLAPPRRIGLATRGRLLSFLDVWGKYSFLDSWFLVLCMSAFSMGWEGGGASLLVHTRPTAAYFAFLLATILSLLLGNVASYFHRQAEAKSAAEGPAAGARAAAATLGRRRALGREGRSLAAHLFVGTLLILSTVVTLVGASVTSFQFGMSGVGADLIFQEERHTQNYGLLSVGAAVSEAMPGNAGLVALEGVFLFISFVVPVLSLLALSLLWLVPLRADQQDSLLHLCHVLDTWSTLDVFVLTILVGHAEFSQLAGRLLKTGSLKTVCVPLEQKFGMQCMELDLGLLPGFALLSAAGLLALAVPKSVHQLCRANAEARDAKFKLDDQATVDVAIPSFPTCAEEQQEEVRADDEVQPADGAESPRGDAEPRGEAVAPSDGQSVGEGSQHAALEAQGTGSQAFVPRASG